MLLATTFYVISLSNSCLVDMILVKAVLFLSLFATLLLSHYYKASASNDIPPSTSKPISQTPMLEEGGICCSKTQDVNVQIKKRSRYVPATAVPNMNSRPTSRSSSAIGKQISSFQLFSPLFFPLSLCFFVLIWWRLLAGQLNKIKKRCSLCYLIWTDII